MFGSELLEVVIGLVFIYLLLSLLTTAVNELIARALALRAETLVDGVKNLIGEENVVRFYNHELIKGFSPTGLSLSLRTKGRGKPSYIDPKIFATVALDILFPRTVDKNCKPLEKDDYIKQIHQNVANLQGALKQPIIQALDENKGLANVRKQLEANFNQSMERVSGWYKRKTQIISLIVGLLVAIAANADSIAITNALLRDAALRDAIVASAEQLAAKEDAELSQNINELQKQLLETQVLGWITSSKGTSDDQENLNPDPRQWPTDIWGQIFKVFGWVITAFALTLGAPFWFDILNKVISVRATGKPPKEPENEQS